MSCREEKTFDGILCEECQGCNLWKHLLKDDWKRFKDDWYASHLHQIKRKQLYKEEMRYKVLGERYHNFVTINFSINICVKDTIDRLIDWNYFEKGDKGVVELHTEKGKHPHFHIISYKKRKRINLIRDISNRFSIDKNFIDVKTHAKLYDKHIDYINGVKKEKKKDYVDQDFEWRSKYCIPHLLEF